MLALDNFIIDKNKITLAAGDSHLQTAFNPNQVLNSMNICSSAEDYFYSYYKLKLVLKSNPHIKNLILGFSPHNISDYHKNKRIGDKAGQMLPKYFMLFDDEAIDICSSISIPFIINYMKFKLSIPISYKSEMKYSIQFFRNKHKIYDYPFWGNYYRSDKSNLSKQLIDESIYRHFYDKDSTLRHISDLQLNYLKKTISLCSQNQITLYLVTTPMTEYYINRIPALFRINSHKIIGMLRSEYENIVYLNLSNISIPDDGFGDGDHVNHLGAKIVSQKINDIINHTNISSQKWENSL